MSPHTTTFHMGTGTSPVATAGTRKVRGKPTEVQPTVSRRLVIRVEATPTVPPVTSLSPLSPLSPRYAPSSSIPFEAPVSPVGHPMPHVVNMHLPASEAAEPADKERESATAFLWAQLIAGVILKTAGGVFPSRQTGGAISASLLQLHLAFLPEDNPEAQATYNALVMGAYAITITYVCGKFLSPMTSAFLTRIEMDSHGNEQVVHRGGSCHGALSVGLAQVGALAVGAKLLLDVREKPEGDERNLVAMACLLGAVKTLTYSWGRGICERLGAKLIPTRELVDAEGNPATAAEVNALKGRRALYQWPVTLLANIWVIASILEVPFDDDPLSAMTGATGAYISVYIGIYEAIVALADIAATAAAARRDGLKMVIGRKAKPAESGSVADPGGAEAAHDSTPPELLQRARNVVDSLERDECMSRLKNFLRRPNPDIYAIVSGLRSFINLSLNLTLSTHVIGALDPGRFPVVTVAVHAFALSLLELSPIVLEDGIAAIATEGKGDREMFDKLHHLSKLQDLMYARVHDSAHPDADKPVIRRQLNAEMLKLIEGNKSWDDVREHLGKLKRSKEPRTATPDPVTDFVLYEPKYPTKAMKEKFGGVLSGEAFLPNSRIQMKIDEFIAELVGSAPRSPEAAPDEKQPPAHEAKAA